MHLVRLLQQHSKGARAARRGPRVHRSSVNPAGRACKSPPCAPVPTLCPNPPPPRGTAVALQRAGAIFAANAPPPTPPFHFLQLLQVRGCPKSHPLGMQSLRPDPGGDAKAHPKPCEVSCSPAKTLLGSNRPDLFFLIPGKTSLSPGLTQPTGAAALTKKGKNPPELTIPRVNPIQAPPAGSQPRRVQKALKINETSFSA